MIVRFFLAAALVTVAAATAVAGDPELESIQQEYEKYRSQWVQAAGLQVAQGRGDDPAQLPPDPFELVVARVRDYANEHAGTPATIPALVMLVSGGDRSVGLPRSQSDGLTAIKRLTESHAADPTLKDHLAAIRYSCLALKKEPFIAFYTHVIAVNPDKEAKAQALYNLGLTHYLDSSSWFADKPSDADREKAIAVFRRFMNQYPTHALVGDVRRLLYDLDKLWVGEPAQPLVAKDVSGIEVDLAKLRGRVVLLNFWNFDVPGGIAMIPRLRDMSVKFQFKPFRMIGVSSDADLDTLKSRLSQFEMTWPDVWEGKGRHISQRWNARILPTIYLIDHKGIIRHRLGYVAGEHLEKLVGELLDKAEE